MGLISVEGVCELPQGFHWLSQEGLHGFDLVEFGHLGGQSAICLPIVVAVPQIPEKVANGDAFFRVEVQDLSFEEGD